MKGKKKQKRLAHALRGSEQPEDALWRSVVSQALADATMALPKTTPLTVAQSVFKEQMEVIRGQARRWFKMQTEDFYQVCALAGLEASRVHAFAMQRIREAIERDQRATAEFLKGSMPGVVANFPDGVGDRRPRATQKNEKIEFSENKVSPL